LIEVVAEKIEIRYERVAENSSLTSYPNTIYILAVKQNLLYYFF
jgi:hypothetical protein